MTAQAIQAVADFFEEVGIPSKLDDDGDLIAALPTKSRPYPLLVQTLMDGNILNFEVRDLFPKELVVNSRHRAEFAAFLLERNWTTVAGSCEMSSEGHVHVVVEFPLAGAVLTKGQIKLVLGLLDSHIGPLVAGGTKVLGAGKVQSEGEERVDQGPAAQQQMEQPDEDSEDPADGGEWGLLLPWILGAMQAHQKEELTAPCLAQGILAAWQADALAAHPAFAYLCEGHSDELIFWLRHSAQYQSVIEPLYEAQFAHPLEPSLKEALTRVRETQDYTPNTAWEWLNAVVAVANDYSRQLQVAYHEAGHAVALHVLSPETVLKAVSIVPEAGSNGRVSTDRNDVFDSVYMLSQEFMHEQMVVMLAGRAAEDRQFGKGRGDSGAVSDFANATQLAWKAITMFGQDPVLGPVCLAAAQSVPSKDGAMSGMAATGWLQDLAQRRLHTWLGWGMAEAERLLDLHWSSVEKLALVLMQRKSLSNADARAVLGAKLAVEGFQLSPLPTSDR